MIIILMGVAGAGKTTIGKLLAADLNWHFIDGDDYHSLTAVSKMERGEALDDSDRKPWLGRLQKHIRKLNRQGGRAVIACSALKKSYRNHLRKNNEWIDFVYLKGDYNLVLKRLEQRKGHFMKADLLASQFAVLEEPEDVLTADISLEPAAIVQFIKQQLMLESDRDRSMRSRN